MKILLADDDAQLLRALRVTLGARGYEVVTAGSGTAALNLAVEHRPDLVVLDLGLPELDGLDVIHGLRGWSTAPILVVSGRTGSADTVDALDAGADDYVTKPFAMDELLARIRALTRRLSAHESESLIGVGDHVVDLTAKAVTRRTGDGGVAVRLTPTEWRVLELLVRNPGRLVTRQTLLNDIWGPSHAADTGYLRLYIAQLRKKLEPEPARPRHLLTESGMGYRFVPGDAPGPG
ncbi:response regulator transcription factor [Rathayibacter sp. VKM Ac-2856]|uniref:response regulator n=1 Tax=unclassified Rathayibacter TaxID=2609250 RepID=UPI0015639718|nr:response regulator transcription factor [Rathayibacter sp. VKM Ac-2858]NQX18396.1 response regulator transcription factor [Rathayibacter sp. VKM Ac-2856]